MDITVNQSGGGILTRGRNKNSDTPEPKISKPVDKPVKQRKTVTFKNVLETSDDVNIVKKVYNPDKVPVVPIIKINKNRDKQRILKTGILTKLAENYSADAPSVNKEVVNSGSETNSSSDTATVPSEKKRHSCRVIKPNKKFLEDGADASNKSLKKLNCKKSSRRDSATRDDDDKLQKTDNFINNTLSSQINSSKLEEKANDEFDGNGSGNCNCIVIN